MNQHEVTTETSVSDRAVDDASKRAPRGVRGGNACLHWQLVSDFHVSVATAS